MNTIVLKAKGVEVKVEVGFKSDEEVAEMAATMTKILEKGFGPTTTEVR